MDTKPYLDYLDKEMTIMGILSAACVAVPAAILGTVMAKDTAAGLFWAHGQVLIVMGSVLCIVGAMFFYKERSDLAWYYGQICLTAALAGGEQSGPELRDWLKNADSWKTWWSYSVGFTCLDWTCTVFASYFLRAWAVPLVMAEQP